MKVLTGIIAGMLILLILFGVAAAAILTKGFTEDDPYGVKSQIKDVIGIGGDSQDKPQDNPQDKPQDNPQDEPEAYTFDIGDSVSLSLSSVGKPLYINSDVTAYQALLDYLTSTGGNIALLYAFACANTSVMLITAYIDYDTGYLNIAFQLYSDGQLTERISNFAQWDTGLGAWHDQIYFDKLQVKAERVVLSPGIAFFPLPESKFTIANYEAIDGLSDVITRVPAELCNNILSITPFINKEV